MPNDPGPPKNGTGDTTRTALLSSATDLFSLYGFDGTTVDLIAKRAGANKAAISYHFGGKLGLYEEILISTFDDVARRLDAVLDPADAADVQLTRLTRAFAEMVGDRPAFPAMILREAVSGGHHLSERVLPYFLAVFVRVRGIFERGSGEGTLRRVDPLHAHLAVIGSLLFFFATAPMRQRLIASGRVPLHEAPDPAAFVATLTEMILHGLAVATGPAGTADDRRR
jgi:AcrR family transcriptional regulator